MQDESIAVTVDRLMQSPGGVMVEDLRSYIQRSFKFYVLLFAVGFSAAFPFTKRVIAWLIEPQRLPQDVSIIVVTPVEFLLLQLRIAGAVGLALIVFLALVHGAWKGSKNEAVRSRLSELDLRVPRPAPALVVTALSSLVLLGLGVFYAWEWLTPMLLEYLTNDAQQAGLSTEWRLSGYAGFIINLALASAIGFQAPVLTTVALRMGFVDRASLIMYRRHIWFSAFVMGALLSPPDPLSLFLVAMPVIVFFELALLLDRFMRS
ncbi:twin-arginine translocase subunit TatC [Candidatus Poseidonia alphae]|uniref:twin-arginine translocase subunit TatC n=1 Tax=Candidatus Poseidonia alphae TaxID=1915863 RepID=UPI0030C66EC3